MGTNGFCFFYKTSNFIIAADQTAFSSFSFPLDLIMQWWRAKSYLMFTSRGLLESGALVENNHSFVMANHRDPLGEHLTVAVGLLFRLGRLAEHNQGSSVVP